MTLSKPFDMTDDRLGEAGDCLRGAVRPLYNPDRKGSAPESRASSVLVAVGGMRFVVTAAHVIQGAEERVEPSPCFLDGPDPLTPFACAEWVSTRPDPTTQSHDSLDFAFVPLTPEQVARIEAPLFLATHHLATPVLPEASRTYIALGYPANRQKRNLPEKLMKVEPWAFGLPEAPPDTYDAYAAAGVDRSTHLLLRYDQTRPMDRAGVKRPPNPRGMSGGGVWLLGNPNERITPDSLPKLHGILIEHRVKPYPVLVAIRIGVVLALMCQVYQDLAPAIGHLCVKMDLHHPLHHRH